MAAGVRLGGNAPMASSTSGVIRHGANRSQENLEQPRSHRHELHRWQAVDRDREGLQAAVESREERLSLSVQTLRSKVCARRTGSLAISERQWTDWQRACVRELRRNKR